MAKRRETVATLHVWLDFLPTNSPFLPSNSTIYMYENQPKMVVIVRSL